ncbi:MAG: LytTR family transcriptional regulator DNA-binding domain-containing protein [Bacteroidales bacterium]|nr:LytTR family transcriptional regulator DNA-binding domain-containing protein [Bacteroidales bacterium]
MKYVPARYLKMPMAVLHFVGMPLFALLFTMFYKPFHVEEVLALENASWQFNVEIMVCIMFGVQIGSRMTMFGVRRVIQLTWLWYIFWCVMEVIVTGLFCALFFSLMSHQFLLYFDVLLKFLLGISAVVMYPYIFNALFVQNISRRAMLEAASDQDHARIRFYDENGNLKLVLASAAVLYIAAEENYVRIYYEDKEELKNFLLRTSMKRISEVCAKFSLARCHRSYFVNTQRIKLLRKERENLMYAELDNPLAKPIPVTKRYYDELTLTL